MTPADCPHEAFDVKASVHRMTDGDGGPVTNYLAEIEIRCTVCDLPFHFVGVPAGYSPRHPMVNVGATMLNAPIVPGEGPIPSSVEYEIPAQPRSAS